MLDHARNAFRVLMLTFAVSILSASAMPSCAPRLPPVSNCVPFEKRCALEENGEHHLEVCSPTRRWHREGDLSCEAVHNICITDAGRAACVPAPDAGTTGDAE